MSEPGITEVGARLVLSGSDSFIAAAARAAASVDALTGSIDSASVAGARLVDTNAAIAASNAKVAGSVAATSGVTMDAALASDAAILGSTKVVAASTVANDGAAAAVTSHSNA